ncbi:MAG TPA: hypothetical protein QF604_21110 [Candidatus Latescibacteria bacterium]|nr:hypothetical protein [Candidatus Latescibacterota bacterium]HJN30412.1 hypothetical protein [Candidatus Latescibacterota bacterium]
MTTCLDSPLDGWVYLSGRPSDEFLDLAAAMGTGGVPADPSLSPPATSIDPLALLR